MSIRKYEFGDRVKHINSKEKGTVIGEEQDSGFIDVRWDDDSHTTLGTNLVKYISKMKCSICGYTEFKKELCERCGKEIWICKRCYTTHFPEGEEGKEKNGNLVSEDGFEGCVKRPIIVKAIQMEEDFFVDTLRGIACGKEGDYLMIGVKGERYPCEREIFEETYMWIDEEEGTPEKQGETDYPKPGYSRELYRDMYVKEFVITLDSKGTIEVIVHKGNDSNQQPYEQVSKVIWKDPPPENQKVTQKEFKKFVENSKRVSPETMWRVLQEDK